MSFPPETLISADELRALLDGGAELLVLDARWQLGRDDGRERYLAGHIPAAVFIDVEGDLSRPGDPRDGRHPVPDDDAFAAAVRRWGVRPDVPVVVYDEAGMLAASRLWWALRRAGVTDVRVLDGGWPTWLAAGGDVQTDEAPVVPSDIEVGAPGAVGMIGTAQAAEWPRAGILVDVRVAERYRGETEPIDPVAGHVPGAVNLPIARLLTEDGRFRPVEDIAAAFDSIGASGDIPVAAYCGSGITAAQFALAGALIDREVTVYPGSWSAWSNRPELPVATGAVPGTPA